MIHCPVSNSYSQLCHMIKQTVHVRAMKLTCMSVTFEKVKCIPKDNSINEVIFQTLNVLEVVDFRFISAFNIPAYIMSSEFTHKVVMKFIPAQFPCTNIFDVKVFEPILRIQRFSI